MRLYEVPIRSHIETSKITDSRVRRDYTATSKLESRERVPIFLADPARLNSSVWR